MQWPGPIRKFLKRPLIRGTTFGIAIGFSVGGASAMLLAEYHVSEVKLPLIAFSRPDRSRLEFDELRAKLRAQTHKVNELNELVVCLTVRPQPRGAQSPVLNAQTCETASAGRQSE